MNVLPGEDLITKGLEDLSTGEQDDMELVLKNSFVMSKNSFMAMFLMNIVAVKTKRINMSTIRRRFL